MPERLGEILKRLGYVNDDQIKVAEKIKRIYPTKLFGEILRELYFASSSEIAKALSIQSGYKYVDIDEVRIDLDSFKMIDKDVYMQYKFIVVGVDNSKGIATVCMSDPYNIVAIDLIKRKLKVSDLEILIAEEEKIIKHIRNYYYIIESQFDKKLKNLLERAARESPANVSTEILDMVITESIVNRATDIHISPQNNTTDIFFRIDGVMEHFISLPKNLHTSLVSKIKVLANLDIAEQRVPQDGSFSYNFMGENYDFRVSTVPSMFGENVVLRVLPKNIHLFDLDTIGFRSAHKKMINRLVNKSKGLFLVTGPTGSGKTTTLYSILRNINALQKNIITVEDPVEYKFPFIKQTQVNEKVDYSFKNAIRALLRQDPDVILIGEIRDKETAEIAIKASITGHFVLSTLHTNTAILAIPRMLDFGIPAYMLSSALVAVLAQRLVRKLCPFCKQETIYTYNNLVNLGFNKAVLEKYNVKQIRGFKAVGCDKCRGTGYMGRKVIAEILEMDEEVALLIEENAPIVKIQKALEKKGMRTMEEVSLIEIVEGVTTPEEVIRVIG